MTKVLDNEPNDADPASSERLQPAVLPAQLMDAVSEHVWLGIAVFDADLHYVYVNAQLAEISKLSPEQHVGKSFLEIAPEVDRATRDRLLAITRDGTPLTHHQVVGSSTDEYELNAFPYGEDGNQILMLVEPLSQRRLVLDRGLHERTRLAEETTRARIEFLSSVGTALGTTVELDQILERICHLAVPVLGDWCSIDLINSHTDERDRLVVYHADPTRSEAGRQLAELHDELPPDEAGIPEVIRSGNPLLIPSIDSNMLKDFARSEHHLQLLQQLGLHSVMIVPLMIRGQIMGSLTLTSADSSRTYGDEDLQLALELANRASLAIENARLFRAAERRAHAALALEHTVDGALLIDQSGRVQLWNPAAVAITGISEDNILNTRIDEAIPGWVDISDKIPVYDSRTRSTGYVETLPLVVSGHEIWIGIVGVRCDSGIVYTFRDLTQDRRVERIRSELVATVSHELRTPLATIYGAAVSLQRSDIELPEDLKSTLLDTMVEQAERLSVTIDEVLISSHLDSGELKIHPQRIDIAEVSRDIARQLGSSAPDGVTVNCRGCNHPVMVWADPSRIRQVLSNIVENAIKYSPDGGPVEVVLYPQTRTARISVTDRGLGIPFTDQPHVFEKFYRVDPNHIRGIKGTGLGLYICRELVELMSGHITLRSEIGRGSTFRVELPMASNQAAVGAATDEA